MAAGDRPDGRPGGGAPRRLIGVACDSPAVAVWSRQRGRRPCRAGGRVAAARAGLERAHPRDRPLGARTHAAGGHRLLTITPPWCGSPTGPGTGAGGAAGPWRWMLFGPAHTLSSGAQPRAPAIAVGPDGTAIVAFFGGRLAGACSRRHAPGAAGFGDAATVSGSFQSFYNPTGNAPGWGDRDRRGPRGGDRLGWLRRDAVHRADQPSGRRRLVPPPTARRAPPPRAAPPAPDPALAVDPAGGATVAWTHNPGRGERRRRRPRCVGSYGCPARTSRRRRRSTRRPPPRRPRSRCSILGPRRRGGVLAAATSAACNAGEGGAGRRSPTIARSRRPARSRRASCCAHGDAAGDARGDLGWDRPTRASSPCCCSRSGARAAAAAWGESHRGRPCRATSRHRRGRSTIRATARRCWAATDHTDAGDVFHVQAGGHDAAAPTSSGSRPPGRARGHAGADERRGDHVVARQLRVEFRRRQVRGGRLRPARVAASGTVHGRRDRHGRGRQRGRRRAAGAPGARARRVRTPCACSGVHPARGLVVLARLQVRRPPRGTVVRLRCAGARCPVRVRRVSRRAAASSTWPRPCGRASAGSPRGDGDAPDHRAGASARCCVTGCAPPRRRACAGSASPSAPRGPGARPPTERGCGTRRAPRPASAGAEARNRPGHHPPSLACTRERPERDAGPDPALHRSGCPFAFSAERQRLRLEWLYGDQLGWSTHMVVLSESASPDFPPEGSKGRRIQLRAVRDADGLDAAAGASGHRSRLPRGRRRTPARAATPPPPCSAGCASCTSPATDRRRRDARPRRGGGGLAPEDVRKLGGRAGGRGGPPRRHARRPQPVPASRAQDYKLGGPPGERRYTCPSYELERAAPPRPTGRRPAASTCRASGRSRPTRRRSPTSRPS